MPHAQPGSGSQTPKSLKLPNISGRKPLPPPKGRELGSVNRLTRDLKLGIVDAAAAHGSDGRGAGGLTGYLFFLAGKHPKAFSSLLGKMLPLQVNSHSTSLVGQVNIVTVPAGQHFDAAEIGRLAQTIEHEPAGSGGDEPGGEAEQGE